MSPQSNDVETAANVKDIEREVTDKLEHWFRNQYHTVLKEEVSLEITKWLQTKYTVVTVILGFIALLGLNQYFTQKLDNLIAPFEASEKRFEESEKKLRNSISGLEKDISDLQKIKSDLETKLANMQSSVETEGFLNQARRNAVVAKTADRLQSRDMLQISLNENLKKEIFDYVSSSMETSKKYKP